MSTSEEAREKWFSEEPDDTPRLRRRYPNFVSGFEETEHEIHSKEDFLRIDWIEPLSRQKSFYRFSQGESGGRWPGSKVQLMIELNEGKTWFVIGWIKSKEKINWLPEWEPKERK